MKKREWAICRVVLEPQLAKVAGTNKSERQQFDNHKTETGSALQAKITSDWPVIYFSPANSETRLNN